VPQTQPFDMLDGIAVFRVGRRASLDEAIGAVTLAISEARERGLRKLMVDASAIGDFQPPGVGARHYLARQWSMAAGGVVQLAVVVRPEMIDPQKFGVMVAANFGASANVFADPAEAVAWLRTQP